MKRYALLFTKPDQVTVQEEDISGPEFSSVLVETFFSAISRGTEMLFYHNQIPEGMVMDSTIEKLKGKLRYPFKYGYSSVGIVKEIGSGVHPGWLNRLVFSFHPHESHFIAGIEDLLPVPEGISPENALFLPNMETAVNLILDGRPLIGERVAVFGLGVVGLLTTGLLLQFPLEDMTCFDPSETHRKMAQDLGDVIVKPPTSMDLSGGNEDKGQFDLCYELSGSPRALDQAIASTRFNGRVIIGSWYGQKEVRLNLGGEFHRSRIQLISSQVSTINPDLSGRWDKNRRFGLAWDQIKAINPQRWITHKFPIKDAQKAYSLLDNEPEATIQVIFDYQS